MQLRELSGVAGGQLRRGTLRDLHDQRLEIRGVEGDTIRGHLVQDAAHGPDVGTPVVGLPEADLGAQVVGCADLRLCASRRALHDLRDAEVTDLDVVALGEEEVARLEVAMDDVHVVDVLQREDCLSEPAEHQILREVRAVLPVLLDPGGEVPTFAVVHGDAEPAVFVEALAVPDDVRVLQRGQHLALLQRVVPLLPGCPAEVDHLDDGLAILLLLVGVLHEDRRAEGPLADLLDLLIAMLRQRVVEPLVHLRHEKRRWARMAAEATSGSAPKGGLPTAALRR
mmetsp:Transcript_31688/g.94138  ORF Transcript_31688/g.94138 Transcript_31688/m.94138 type:complete len:283 (+) Transcript_31688:436-1284(+)